MQLEPIFVLVFKFILDKPNSTTVLFQSLKSLEISVNFLEKLSNLLKLSMVEKIGVGLALSDAKNTDTWMFGVVKSQRSIWRLRTITDFFWAIMNFIGVFFSTMFSMEKTDAYRKGSGSSKKWDGGPGGPGSGPYGGGPRGPPRGLDNVPCLPVAHAVDKVLRYL
uniref:Selenoprotein K n=1 Tax=Salix viminalis TaxID=40686 RepID=A0A6N2LV22_SALVM